MKIGIIGSGISGLTAAHHLHREHALTLFEAGDHVGGHTHTHDVEVQGRQFAVDTGFIVYNERNYPNFTRLLAELGVATRPTEMSFSVRCEKSGLEWCGTSLNSVFAQRRNLLRPSFLGMLRDMARFNREAVELLGDSDPHLSIGMYLERKGYGRSFIENYLIPMGAAIWSTGAERMLDCPAVFFVRFFANHGMLQVNGRPKWRVIEGGSRQYVERLIAPFREQIRLHTKVLRINRMGQGVQIVTSDGDTEHFDEVIVATHSDQALRMLGDPTPEEQRVLGSLSYQPNEAVLHTDTSLLPRRKRAWASWNYVIPREGQPRVSVTYNMNILQGIPAPETLCVTLNQSLSIDPTRILRWMQYHHPVYDTAGVMARGDWSLISGWNHTHYCGAYWGNGFHEDGVNSGLAVCRALSMVLQS